MATKGNIPVFESPEDLDANKGARYVGPNTPVIRELTILNEEKNARLMKIVVRGGSLAGEQRWWTLAGNLVSRTKSVCPENTPRKCSEFAVHFCDGSGCRCIDAGHAPDDEIGNMVIEGVATMGMGPVAFGARTLITSLGAIRIVPASIKAAPTLFADTSINLTKHAASPQTLQKAEEFIATNHMKSFQFARSLIGKWPLSGKVDVVEVSAINYYTGLGYGEINQALRAGDQVVLQKFRPVIEAACSGLAKMTDNIFVGNVYRGAHLRKEVSDLYEVGSQITEKAFTSTSRTISRKFSGNTLFVIKSKTGKMIDELSAFKSEQEVLFPPGTVFKVLGRTIDGKTTKILMEQVSN
ncbi:MAG: hypothetical protein EBR09_13725 [Proteobacteria bacterium]|nr:hypothetical protein [Pseudomonadota bacterium]